MDNNMEAPEGGWGYVVGGALAVTLIVERGLLHTYGIIYEDFFSTLGGQTTEFIIFLNTYTLCTSIAGLFMNSVFKRFSCRQTGFAGALLLALGSVLTTFANSFIFVLITFSIMQGFAFGLLVPAVFICFTRYFVKHRARMYFLSKPLIATGSIGFPVLINYLIEEYDHRGMLLILAGINLQLLVTSLLLRPAKWRVKENPNPTVEATVETNIAVGETSQNIGNMQEQSSTADINTNTTEKDKNPKDLGKMKRIMVAVTNFFDLTLLKDLTYVNILIGSCFVEFSETNFIALLPGYLVSIGWKKEEAALCLSTSGFGDLASRILLAILGFFIVLKGRYVYFVAATFSFFGRIAFLFVDEYLPVTAIVTYIVFFKTMVISANALMYAEQFSKERFPAAYGLYFFFSGILSVALGAVIGTVKDYTGSYDVTFYILISCFLFCIIPWTLEIFWKRIKGKSRTL